MADNNKKNLFYFCFYFFSCFYLIWMLVLGIVLPGVAWSSNAWWEPLDASRLQLGSVNAMVVDLETGQPLYAKNAENTVPVASITKLMTAMVVLDAGQSLNDVLRIDQEDYDQLKSTYSRLRVGHALTRREMLRLALMSSENRAASSLSRHYPGGQTAFVSAMNAKAKALGMQQTRFVEPTGLSAENVSTARDLVKLVAASSQYSLIRDFTTMDKHGVSVQKDKKLMEYHNTNLLVRKGSWDIEVSKTGYTREAGRCLVLLTRIEGHSLAIVLLDSLGKLTPIGDAARIRQWIETGAGGSVPRMAKVYEREKRSESADVALSSGGL